MVFKNEFGTIEAHFIFIGFLLRTFCATSKSPPRHGDSFSPRRRIWWSHYVKVLFLYANNSPLHVVGSAGPARPCKARGYFKEGGGQVEESALGGQRLPLWPTSKTGRKVTSKGVTACGEANGLCEIWLMEKSKTTTKLT